MEGTKPNLPTRAEYDRYNKTKKIELLSDLLGFYHDKDIRDALGFSPSSWYNLLNVYGLLHKRGEGTDSRRKSRPKGKDTPATDSKSRTGSRNDTRKIIDAEYAVVTEDLPKQQSAPPKQTSTALAVQGDVEADRRAAAVQSGSYLSFDVNGSPEAVQKRLTAISNLIALEDGDLRLKIEVYKA